MKAKTLGEDITEGERLYNLIKELRAAGYTEPVVSLSVIYDASSRYDSCLPPNPIPGTVVGGLTTITQDSFNPAVIKHYTEVYMGLDTRGDKIIFVVYNGEQK